MIDRSLPGCILLLLFLAGCGGGAKAAPEVAVRDSAGIRIVENRGGAVPGALPWRVDERPLLDLAVGDGDAGPRPFQVTGAIRLDDGRIVVASAGTNTLEIYGPDGRHLRTAGRAGEGPGEFRALFWVGRLPGDSIGAWDPALGRLTIFAPDGGFARVVTPRRPLGMFPRAHAVTDGGGVVLAAGAGAGGIRVGEVQRDTLEYVVLDRSGEARPLGRFPGAEMLSAGSPAGGLLVRPLPFGRQTLTAARGRRVYVATGDAHEIAVYEPGGGVRELIRETRPRVAVRPQDVRDYRRTLVTLGAEGDAALRRSQEEMLEKAPYPAAMPAYTGLEADPEGNLWVEEPRRPGDARGSVWSVISREGRVRGTVRMPPGLAVKEVGPDWVLGVHVDGDEVEHVRLHRLARSR